MTTVLDIVQAAIALVFGDGGSALFYAQLPDFGGNSSGSVSHLVAATMQTAGVYVQAEILANFQSYITKLAALCYLASVIGALLSAGLFGNYQRALYLLIGPPLFFFMITTTHPVDGTLVQTGDRTTDGSVQDQLRFLRTWSSSGTFNQSADVSYFFIGFDKLVSNIVQGVVSVIIDTRDNEDLIVKARERLFSWMLMATPNDNGFAKLIAMGTMGDCAEVMRRRWEMQNHRLDTRNPSLADDNLDDIGRNAKRKYDLEKVRPRFELDPEVAVLISRDPKTQDEYAHEKWSCEQIWEDTHRVAKAFAERTLDINNFIGTGGEDGHVPWDRVQREVEAALAQGASASDVLAVYIIKNAMKETSNSSMTAGVFDRVPFNAERRAGIFEDVAGVHRYGGYLKVHFFARAIPYIQGLFLYLLAAAFPFFAVFLVMPGRATTFLIWISLWIWVKSWDVGFALVSVARKLLWLFVRGGVNKTDPGNVPANFQPGSAVDWAQPESVFALMSQNDPLATQNTYFTIIALLTIGVPFITAHMCLGATALWDIFHMNLNQRGDYYFMRRMKQVTRSDYATPAERAQDYGRHMAEQKGHAEGMRNMQTGGNSGLRGQGQSDLPMVRPNGK